MSETRDDALTHWRQFCSRILPGIVRRIAAWKRLTRTEQGELVEELQQELAADCLEHAALIAAQPPRERHGRWIRIVERFTYRNYVVARRHVACPSELAREAEPAIGVPATELPPLERLANGRRNLRGTAARWGTDERALRTRLDAVAEGLGADHEHRAFWRARLAEALTGLAADLLRDRGEVHLVPRARRRPDPAGRMRRIRRMLVHFHVRPSTLRERTILRRWLWPRASQPSDAPRQLLEAAATLAPGDRATWLWLFEARLAAGDLRGAAAAVRRCRELGAPVTASALARARLLEARGRPARAVQLVQRAARRWPRDRALARVAAELAASVAGGR
jgi:hypothetical protein